MNNYIWENIFRTIKTDRSLKQKLKENILFVDLTPPELKVVENIIHVRNYRPSEVIFRQGDIGVGMYIIGKGTVNIYVEEIVPSTGESKPVLVTQLKEGDFLGDLALVEENGRRSATAIASEETMMIGFFRSDLIEISQRNPIAGVKILMRLGEVLGTRLKETTAKITELRKENKK
jgi:CRP/FNR family cyclic AMP-dependent transcriptional regulator